MAARLGDYYLATKKPTEAIAAYQQALTDFPNDMKTLIDLKRAYEAANNPSEAATITKKIEDLMGE
jgi:tetratricopeptide (TPR) repeat protein